MIQYRILKNKGAYMGYGNIKKINDGPTGRTFFSTYPSLRVKSEVYYNGEKYFLEQHQQTIPELLKKVGKSIPFGGSIITNTQTNQLMPQPPQNSVSTNLRRRTRQTLNPQSPQNSVSTNPRRRTRQTSNPQPPQNSTSTNPRRTQQTGSQNNQQENRNTLNNLQGANQNINVHAPLTTRSSGSPRRHIG